MAPTPAPRALRTFYSYAHEDERHRAQLATHMSPLVRQGIISEWHDRDISAGTEFDPAIAERIESADLILLLVSPAFVQSDYCWGKEMTRALERHRRGEARVIPVVVRPTYWDGMPFAGLEALPRDRKPVALWGNRDEAWVNVVEGISRAASELRAGVRRTEGAEPSPLASARRSRGKPGSPPPRATPAPSTAPQADRPARRTIFDAGHRDTLPGKPVRQEGDPPSGDAVVDAVYDSLGATHGFFWNAFGRDSIDGRGLPLHATVHYHRNYTNAFWNGQQMVLGDGDGVIFASFTGIDVVAKEFANGVLSTTGLVYWGESGALFNSVASVFAVLARQYTLRQVATDGDWVLGTGMLAPGVRGRGISSLASPGTAYDDPRLGKDPQPDHVRGYLKMEEDNGGIHVNSGIPNRAFYLAATALGGHAWERAGRIWYDAVTSSLPKQATFREFAALTARAASRRFGARSPEVDAVRHGWTLVGIDPAKRTGRLQSAVRRRARR